MSANLQQLEHLISRHKGHLYHYGRDGIIVTSLFGKEFLHIPSNGENGISLQDIDQVKQFFTDICLKQLDKNTPVVKPITWIDIEQPMLNNVVQMKLCGQALKEMMDHYAVAIRIHFVKNPACRPELLSPFIDLLRDDVKNGIVHLQLHGTFTKMEDSVMEFLFSNNIQLYYVLEATSFKQHSENICHLAEYGFRVPCVWYVDNKNINLITSLIDEAMQWNYYAGFSLPLAAERVIGCTNNNPSDVDYLRLIFDSYQKYQCYDNVFYPMNDALLESGSNIYVSGVTTWRWDQSQAALCKHIRYSHINRIHKILLHSFVWQSHLVKSKLTSFLPND